LIKSTEPLPKVIDEVPAGESFLRAIGGQAVAVRVAFVPLAEFVSLILRLIHKPRI